MADKLTFHQRHKGKIYSGAGGLTIGLALMHFASKSELSMLKDRLTEEHRDRMDAQIQCETRYMHLLHKHQP